MSKPSESTGADENTNCPFCLQTVDENNSGNCMICMRCKQRMHGRCPPVPPGPKWRPPQETGLLVQNRDSIKEKRKKGDVFHLSDYVLRCPVCNGDSIAHCDEPYEDVNEGAKEAAKEAAKEDVADMRKGGRILRRQRKSRKTRKNNRRTRNKNARKSKLRRKR